MKSSKPSGLRVSFASDLSLLGLLSALSLKTCWLLPGVARKK